VAIRSRLLSVLIVLSSVVPAPGQEPVILKHRLIKDWPIYQDITTETMQKTKVAGMEVKTVHKEMVGYSWTAVEQDKDANWILKQKIQRVIINSETGDSPPYAFDSTKKAAANDSRAEFYKAMVGSEFKFTVNRDMKVVKVEGREDFVKRIGGGNPQMEQLLKHWVTDEALKSTAESFVIGLPSQAVNVGDHWKQLHSTDLGPIGQLEETRDYSYKGKGDDNLERIQFAALVKYAKPDPAVIAGLPFTVTKAEFKVAESSGLIKFDNRNGRVASADLTLHSVKVLPRLNSQ
jgi:hypothetical protein